MVSTLELLRRPQPHRSFLQSAQLFTWQVGETLRLMDRHQTVSSLSDFLMSLLPLVILHMETLNQLFKFVQEE